MAVDGYLNFDTKINTLGFEKGTESISKVFAALDKSIKELATAIKSISDIKFTADTSEVEKAANDVNTSVENISEQEIKIEADTSAIEPQVESVVSETPDAEIDVNADVFDAEQAVDSINNELNAIDDRQVSPEIDPDISELDSISTEFQSDMDEITESSENASEKMSENFDNAGSHMKKSIDSSSDHITQSLGKIKSQLKGVAAAVGIAFGVREIVSFSKEAKEAWNVQLEAETKLEQVMKNTMGATQEQIQATKDWASELQQVGVIGDEIQLSGLQELSTYVENADSLKTMNVVLNDMLAQQYGLNATAENAVTISTMLGKVLEGQTSALSRYGYSFTEAQEQLLKYGTEEQKVATLAEVVEASVGGMNEALAQTPAGRLKQVSNNMGDVKEQFGQAVTNIQALFLPALERLSSALAKVASLAVSVSQSLAAVFGVELDNSTAITSNISDSVASQNDLTDAVEETAKAQENALAGFDKINKLSGNDKKSSTAAPAAVKTTATVSADTRPAEKAVDSLSEKLQKYIEPIKLAWDVNSNQLKKSAKTALRSIKSLISGVAESIGEVWMNGSGERFVGNILILLGDVLGIIGDISSAAKKAWDDGGRGTSLVQSYANRWNALLELIHSVSDAFRKAWNSGRGEEILGNIFNIITNINNTTANLRSRFTEAWNANNNGVKIWESALDIVNTFLSTVDRITEANVKWSQSIDFKPILESVDDLLEAFGGLADSIGDTYAWIYEEFLLPIASWVIEDAAPASVDVLSGAIEVLTSVLNALKPLGKWLLDKFLKPIGKWSGSVIVSALDSIAGGLRKLSDWVKVHQTEVEVLVTTFVAFGAALKIASLITAVTAALSAAGGVMGVVTAITSGLTAVTTALAGAFAFLTSPITLVCLGIAAVIAIGVLLVKHWDEIKAKLAELCENIKENITDAVAWITEKFNSLVKFFKTVWSDITAIFSVVGSWFKEKFKSAYDAIKGVFSKIGQWFGDRWNDIKNAFSVTVTWFGELFTNAWEGIKTAFSSVKSYFEEVWDYVKAPFVTAIDWFSEKFTAVKDKIVEIFDNVSEALKTPVNAMIGLINGLLDKLETGLNYIVDALNKALSIDIPDNVPGIGGTHFGLDLPHVDLPEIPKLAQGTVVPANYGEFLSILGDNKRETEVVSPLSTIKQALKEALAESRGIGGGDITVRCILDDREIGRAAIKAIDIEKARKGG